MAHDHQHHHTSKEEKKSLYGRALAINTTVWFAQFLAIFIFSAGSLSLLGDWAHGGADLLILVATFWVLGHEIKNPQKNHDGKKSVLTVIAVLILWATAAYVFDEALGRIIDPPEFHGWLVGWLAILSTSGNLYAHRMIDTVQKCEHDRLDHANLAHLITDAAISFSVFVSAVANVAFGAPAIDAWISIVVGIWMVILGKRIMFDKHHH